jgi:hypothetical protein
MGRARRMVVLVQASDQVLPHSAGFESVPRTRGRSADLSTQYPPSPQVMEEGPRAVVLGWISPEEFGSSLVGEPFDECSVHPAVDLLLIRVYRRLCC